MIPFLQRLFATTANILPAPPEETQFHPRIGKLVKASGTRIKASADILQQEIEDLIRENIELKVKVKRNK